MSYAYAAGSNALLFPRCTLSSRFPRVHDPLNCTDAEGLYPSPVCFVNINFALFVMNIQRMISSNQLSNLLTCRVYRNYRRVSERMLPRNISISFSEARGKEYCFVPTKGLISTPTLARTRREQRIETRRGCRCVFLRDDREDKRRLERENGLRRDEHGS